MRRPAHALARPRRSARRPMPWVHVDDHGLPGHRAPAPARRPERPSAHRGDRRGARGDGARGRHDARRLAGGRGGDPRPGPAARFRRSCPTARAVLLQAIARRGRPGARDGSGRCHRRAWRPGCGSTAARRSSTRVVRWRRTSWRRRSRRAARRAASTRSSRSRSSSGRWQRCAARRSRSKGTPACCRCSRSWPSRPGRPAGAAAARRQAGLPRGGGALGGRVRRSARCHRGGGPGRRARRGGRARHLCAAHPPDAGQRGGAGHRRGAHRAAAAWRRLDGARPPRCDGPPRAPVPGSCTALRPAGRSRSRSARRAAARPRGGPGGRAGRPRTRTRPPHARPPTPAPPRGPAAHRRDRPPPPRRPHRRPPPAGCPAGSPPDRRPRRPGEGSGISPAPPRRGRRQPRRRRRAVPPGPHPPGRHGGGGTRPPATGYHRQMQHGVDAIRGSRSAARFVVPHRHGASASLRSGTFRTVSGPSPGRRRCGAAAARRGPGRGSPPGHHRRPPAEQERPAMVGVSGMRWSPPVWPSATIAGAAHRRGAGRERSPSQVAQRARHLRGRGGLPATDARTRAGPRSPSPRAGRRHLVAAQGHAQRRARRSRRPRCAR